MADDPSSTPPLTPVRLEGREIGPPVTISPQARAALSLGAETTRPPRPAAHDIEGWRQAGIASTAMWDPIAAQMLEGCTSSVETMQVAGVTCYVATPASVGSGSEARVYLYIHGGALVFGGGRFAYALGAVNAQKLGVKVVSVDYRMPPDHPYPAAPQDCLAVYKALLETHDPRRIAVGGASAGGNLAAAVTLMIRDQRLPMPGAVLLMTPEVDLTEQGDTFATNADLDVVLKRGLPECNELYAAGQDLTHPYLSPLLADFSAGFPPTFIQSGTRDLFLSNSVLMHRKLRKAGVEADLHVWEAMPHGGFGSGAPEDEEIYAESRRFIERWC